MCDYIAQNSPPDMSFRVLHSVTYRVVWFLKLKRVSEPAQDRAHFDVFAGCRSMQREYCALAWDDWDLIEQIPWGRSAKYMHALGYKVQLACAGSSTPVSDHVRQLCLTNLHGSR